MNQRLRWWVLPGAMIVLLRVLTLGEPDAVSDATAVDASERGPAAAVLEASGRRLGAVPVPAASDSFVVAVPDRAGERGTMRLWRRLATGREATPWLTFRAHVRGDGTVPIAGLAAGGYDVELQVGDLVLFAGNATAPGTVTLQPVTAAPR